MTDDPFRPSGGRVSSLDAGCSRTVMFPATYTTICLSFPSSLSCENSCSITPAGVARFLLPRISHRYHVFNCTIDTLSPKVIRSEMDILYLLWPVFMLTVHAAATSDGTFGTSEGLSSAMALENGLNLALLPDFVIAPCVWSIMGLMASPCVTFGGHGASLVRSATRQAGLFYH